MAILTGPKIRENIKSGQITCAPYDERLVGTNSVDLHLHKMLRVYKIGATHHRLLNNWYEEVLNKDPPTPPSPSWMDALVESVPLDMGKENATEDLEIPKEGMMMWPGILYLGRTVETVGAKKYAPWFDGRSSVGRLGIHVHVTAGRGDTGWRGTVTLEMHVVHPVRVYAGVKPICQASFFETIGDLEEYEGRYQDQVEPTASRIHQNEFDRVK